MFSIQHIAKISVTESAYFCSLLYIIIKYVYIIGYLVVCIDYIINLNGFTPYKGWRIKQASKRECRFHCWPHMVGLAKARLNYICINYIITSSQWSHAHVAILSIWLCYWLKPYSYICILVWLRAADFLNKLKYWYLTLSIVSIWSLVVVHLLSLSNSR